MELQYHECGGAILSGENAGEYVYCDQCGAYSYDGPVPSGTDKAANRKAWDDAAPRSPDAAPSLPDSYRIRVTPQYYAETIGAPSPHYAADEHGGVASFATRSDAQAWIDAAESCAYHLSHGEHSRPDYEIETGDAPDGWVVYNASEAGQPELHGIAAGEQGDWHYQPEDAPDGEVWSSGYATRQEALDACWGEVQTHEVEIEPDDAPDEEPQCESGQWSGTQCSDTATTTIEWMPEYLRGTHAAAGSRGRWPANGSIRSRVCRACADEMLEALDDWAQEVDA